MPMGLMCIGSVTAYRVRERMLMHRLCRTSGNSGFGAETRRDLRKGSSDKKDYHSTRQHKKEARGR